MAPGEHFAEALHARQHQRRAVLAAALVAAQIKMLADIFALDVQALQLVNKLGGIHKTEVDPLPGQRMDGMRGIADQRQSVGGKLTGIAAGQRENFTFTCQLAEAKAIIERDIQRLVEGGFISLL